MWPRHADVLGSEELASIGGALFADNLHSHCADYCPPPNTILAETDGLMSLHPDRPNRKMVLNRRQLCSSVTLVPLNIKFGVYGLCGGDKSCHLG